MKPTNAVGDEIIEHWYTLVASQHFSSKEFYDHIEEGIRAQKVPSLEISRIDLAEGGLLSDNREYLRMKRERLTFDICAAPVGVNYFFSYRFYAEPVVVGLWDLAVGFGTFCFLFYVSIRALGFFVGPLMLFTGTCGFAWVMRNAVGMGLRDLDATLIKLPSLGPIYERFFRRDTYYRQDTRLAYCSIVSALVKQEVERLTAAKGVRLIEEFTYSPIMKGLYHTKATSLQAAEEVSPVVEPVSADA